MKGGRILRIGLVAVSMVVFATAGLEAQTGQNRIPQQIIVNGQHANGAYVTAQGGGMQTFTCSSPQQYTTADGASQGWTCFDQATGVWLLNAVPPTPPPTAPAAQVPAPAPAPAPLPAPAPAPQATVVYPPAVVYQQPAVVYAPAPYPVVVAPAYPPSVVLGAAVIGAAGRIASAAIFSSGHHYFYGPGFYYPGRVFYRGRW
jgi:hypothetical protein